MPIIGTLSLVGRSGTRYTFDVYPYDTEFNPVSAIYCVSHRHVRAQTVDDHSLIYIGQTENLKNRFDSHHDEACFLRNSANCKSVLLEPSEFKRLAIERDLLENYRTLCNG